MDEYPEELRQSPVPVVALIGHTSLHPLIEKCLSSKTVYDNTQTRVFKLVSLELTSLPTKKEKRANYELYVPAGILKANWMHKHKNVLPSVIVMFFNWDQAKDVKTKEIDICTQIEIAKQNSRARNVKILVALVVSHVLADVNDEAFSSLRKRADMDTKNFIFFNKTDPKPSTKKLEKVIQEMANMYYTEAARRIKQMKNHLNKSIQLSLLVRLHFKLGYYSEFRVDKSRSSLKHYTQAYTFLREMIVYKTEGPRAATDVKMNEIKIVASYINFKICLLFLALGNAPEATNQFQKHIKFFKNPSEAGSSVTSPTREYEHWAWVSREYKVFGELLNLFPSQISQQKGYQHPSYYFQTAAKYASMRTRAAQKTIEIYRTKIEPAKEPPKPASIDFATMTYVGQPMSLVHPLEQITDSFSPNSSEEFERSVANELAVDHSANVIDLLTKAWHFYKQPKSRRMILYIASLMAQEHFSAGQWERAKKFFDKISKSYRKEQWWTLLTQTLEWALVCARELGLPHDYIKYALELLSENSTVSGEKKVKLQDDIVNLLTGQGKLGLTDPLEINMDIMKGLIFAKVRFLQATASSHQTVTLLLRVLSKFPKPIKFSKIRVTFNDPKYNQEILSERDIIYYYEDKQHGSESKPSGNKTGINLEKDKAKIFELKIVPNAKMDLKCTSISFELGRKQSPVVFIRTIVHTENKEESENIQLMKQKGDALSIQQIMQSTDLKDVALGDKKSRFFEKPVVNITDSESHVQIQLLHSAPALLNEYYPVNLELKNNGDDMIKDGVLTWDVTGLSGYCSIFGRRSKAEPMEPVNVGNIPPNSLFRQTVYVFSSSQDEKQVSVNFAYEAASHKTNTASTIFFPVQPAFSVRFQLLGEDMQQPPNECISMGEPLLLLAEISPLPEYPLILNNAPLLIAHNEAGPTAKLLSSTSDQSAVVTRNNRYAVWFHIVPTQTGESVVWGDLEVSWKRQVDPSQSKNEDAAPFTVTKMALPPMRIELPVFSAEITVPSTGVIGQVVPHIIKVTNYSTLLQDFSLAVTSRSNPKAVVRNSQPGSKVSPIASPVQNPAAGTGISDLYLISGDRQISFTVLPQSTYTIRHQILPIVAGNLPLPYFQVVSKRYGKELAQTKSDERFLFVKNTRSFPDVTT